MSSFTSQFNDDDGFWQPNEGFTGCACLDLDADDYEYYEEGFIILTPSSDCARITGDNNKVNASRPRRSAARREGPAPTRDAARAGHAGRRRHVLERRRERPRRAPRR